MARNLKFFFDADGSPCARGPLSEKVLMAFLETDVQGDDHICHDLMEDISAIEAEAADEREFIGNAHLVSINKDGIKITTQHSEPAEVAAEAQPEIPAEAPAEVYETGLKHFREILEDWEAFILDESEPGLA